MRASAQLAVAPVPGSDRMQIVRLHSEAPLVLRPTAAIGSNPIPRWDLARSRTAWVSTAAGAAGPVGGDDLQLSVAVEAGAALVLRSVSASLALPGIHGQPSRSQTTVRIAAHGVFVWLPGPLIAARGCSHQETVRVSLEAGARFFLREETLLGRHGEATGAVRRRLRVCLDGQPLLDQELAVGSGADGWEGAAVTGGRRALGSVLIVDPDLEPGLASSRPPGSGTSAILPLEGPAVLITALADDSLSLRHRLDAGLGAIEAALPSGVECRYQLDACTASR